LLRRCRRTPSLYQAPRRRCPARRRPAAARACRRGSGHGREQRARRKQCNGRGTTVLRRRLACLGTFKGGSPPGLMSYWELGASRPVPPPG
jgi:hypothetical protein